MYLGTFTLAYRIHEIPAILLVEKIVIGSSLQVPYNSHENLAPKYLLEVPSRRNCLEAQEK